MGNGFIVLNGKGNFFFWSGPYVFDIHVHVQFAQNCDSNNSSRFVDIICNYVLNHFQIGPLDTSGFIHTLSSAYMTFSFVNSVSYKSIKKKNGPLCDKEIFSFSSSFFLFHGTFSLFFFNILNLEVRKVTTW